mmetsp:Transcript_23810/g.45327  ORF Transcript_23810/g.45327 Transcript_23810/m.45327 type:complete len:223 (+) Transcript_23810:170-838(+)
MVMMTSSSATTSNHHAPMGGMSSPPPTTATNEPTWTPFVSPTPSHLQQQQQQHMNHATMTNSDHHKRYRGGEGKDQHTAQSRPFTSSPWALPPPQYPLQHHHPTAPPAMCIPNHSHHDDQFQQQQQQQQQQQEEASKRRRNASYVPPRQIPKTLTSAMGSLAAAHQIRGTTAAATTGNLRAHLRQQLSGSNLVGFLGNHHHHNDDSMDVEDHPHERPRSMSF